LTVVALFLSLLPGTAQDAARPPQSAPAVAEPTESPRLAALQKELAAKGPDALTRFWRDVKGKTPLVEPVTGDDDSCRVTYVWRAEQAAEQVYLIGGVPDPSPKELRRPGDTELRYRTERTPRDARFGYAFAARPRPGARSALRPDPLAARTYDDQSVAELPGAPPQPWSDPVAGVARGRLEDATVRSDALKAERRVTVYTPPGYDPAGGENGLLVVFDGESAGGDLKGFNPVPGPAILDNLIAKQRIAPTVAVFVESGATRDRDLGCYPPFAEFVARELVPWVRSRYRVCRDPHRAVVSGFSRGGLAAAYCGLRHPEVFGNVLAQSGAFWWYPEADRDAKAPTEEREVRRLGRQTGWLTRQFATTERRPVRFYLEAGRFEQGHGGGILLDTRRLRDVLEAKGYAVLHREFSGGHDFIVWRGSLADGLIALVGK
jgi:enterochelin esterase family protein